MSHVTKKRRKDSFVKYLITSGPVWDSYLNHDGKTECFWVMKTSGNASSSPFVPVLNDPVEVKVKVGYVASPIHDKKKIIRGEIAETVVCESRSQGFEDDIGMEFLAKGVGVELEYNVNTKTGHLTFYNSDDKGCLRAHSHDGWLSVLVCEDVKGEYQRSSLCQEIAYYAQLDDSVTDCRQIMHAGEFSQYVSLNPDRGDLFIDMSSVRWNTPIIWL